jgi:AraC-like DNA-binding protein
MDPLTQAIRLLRPKALTWKEAECVGDWALGFPSSAGIAFCLIAEGDCRLQLADRPPILLCEGEFLLLTAPAAWTLSHGEFTEVIDGRIGREGLDRLKTRVGERADGAAITRLMGGQVSIDGANGGLLAGLPSMVHIQGDHPGADRLRRILALIDEEAFSDRPGRSLILERLLEVVIVEAIRHRPEKDVEARKGLLAGLADPAIAAALRAIHSDVQRNWTVEQLAAVAGASRSVFAARFARTVGLPPIDYLLNWRMALAKDTLRDGRSSLSEVAFQCGYQSASAFSTAFRRIVGCAPARYAAAQRAAA